MQGGRINTGQSQAKWVITTLNNWTNIRSTWQLNLKGGVGHHSPNNASQCTVCRDIISCNKLWEANGTRRRLGLSFLPITDINNVHVTPNFHDPWMHHPISVLGTWKGALMRLSRGNLLHFSFPDISFPFASHSWIKAVTCLIWPLEIWRADVGRQNWTVACCNPGRKPLLTLTLKEEMEKNSIF